VGETPDRRTGGPAVGDSGAHRPPDRPTVSPSLLRESPPPPPPPHLSAGDSTVPRLELREWGHRYGVVAGITTRPLNLGLWSEENVGQVMTRWRALCAAFRPTFPTVVLSHQVHGTVVQWHRQATDGWLILDGIDGHATGIRGLLLTITLADCVPVYLAVPQKGVVALLHAGWRGTAGRILERGVDVMRREAFVEASDIIMHCGVGICGACYEVGSEVRTRLSGRPEATPGHVDLRDVLTRQAHELGVTQVSRSPWCSAHDREHFFSHRGSGGRDGRMVAYVGMPA
jgi:purine-nucleoside/S-methyl-5'-thioadenosine phosphorylase / adenosine deaminase